MASLDRPPAFERLVAPARAQPGLGRLAAGFLFVEFAFVVGAVMLAGAFDAVLFSSEDADLYADTPGGVLVVLAVPALLIGWTAAAAATFQGRSLADLVGPLDARLFLGAAAITFGLAALSEMFFWYDPLVDNLPLGTLLAWAPAALLLLALQTGGEELFYRGYLQTQLAARFDAPVIWLGGPALLFALAHVDVVHFVANGTWADNDAIWLATSFAAALVAGDLVRVTGSLMAAWGWHFGHNLFAVLVVSPAGSVSGLALWTLPYGIDAPVFGAVEIGTMLLGQLVVWAVLRLWLEGRRDAAG